MSPKYLKGIAVAAFCVALSAPVSYAQSLLGGFFSATPPAFSPDGDDIQDHTLIRFTLADTASTISLIVFAADSITPVDTLLAPTPDSTLGIKSFTWDGRTSLGALAPEGPYIVTVSGSGAVAQDTTVSIPVFIDVTAPSIQVTGVSPAIYVPGVLGAPSVLDITFVVTNISPPYASRVLDELQFEINTPAGSPVAPEDLAGAISFDPPLAADNPPSIDTDGTYHFKWDASTLSVVSDGNYRIGMFIVDSAGYSDTDTALADFDADRPDVRYTNVATGSSISVVPDSLRGWAWDKSGIDTLRVKYSSSSPYLPVTPARVSNDTAFFAVVLADSITSEGDQLVTVRATDGVGRVTPALLNFTVDFTRPTPPALEPFDGIWHSTTYQVRGTVPVDAEIASVIRIYRNGALVDSVLAALITTFSKPIAVSEGENRIVATHVDGAGNESGPSNTVVATLVNEIGVFMPVPFRPNDEFVVNAQRSADRIEVRVYDLTGDLVVILESTQTAANHAIRWDGRNADGVTVKKGPLIVVATADFSDGARRRHREIFLYEPGQ